MGNLKTIMLSRLTPEEAIKQLKDEVTPKGKREMNPSKRCTALAGKDVLDDWGDTCEGYQCEFTKGHEGDHMSTDGANGWVYFK